MIESIICVCIFLKHNEWKLRYLKGCKEPLITIDELGNKNLYYTKKGSSIPYLKHVQEYVTHETLDLGSDDD